MFAPQTSFYLLKYQLVVSDTMILVQLVVQLLSAKWSTHTDTDIHTHTHTHTYTHTHIQSSRYRKLQMLHPSPPDEQE